MASNSTISPAKPGPSTSTRPSREVYFPKDFMWGAATAAYQIEGAAREDGRGPSVWDVFLQIPGHAVNGENGDVACDHYHRWKDDIELMKRIGLRAYRLSISWPRVFPTGRGKINEKGLGFYQKLIDGLCEAKIVPFVTLSHWDLPVSLQFEMNGWLNDDLPQVFADYAALMYDRLGDRVKHWMTLNEPWVVVDGGYFHGAHPPGIKDRALGYRAGHNQLRAHAYAVANYRSCRHRGGKISFALNTGYSFPATSSSEDIAAAERAVQNFGGWFADPTYHGDYPAMMRERLGSLLPEFSTQDSALLKRSIDYIALNYYTSDVVRHAAGAGAMEYEVVPQPDTWHTEMNWPVRADGYQKLLCWLNKRYPGLPFYITENGAACPDKPDESGFVNDQDRITYLRDHFKAAHAAMKEGVDLRGYLVWSLMDNLEWSLGFDKRFGLIHCDRKSLKRTIKASGNWYADVIASNGGSLFEGK